MPVTISHLTVAELAALGGRDYIGEVKSRLRDDDAWLVMLDPALAERTRWGLVKMIESMDRQIETVEGDEAWLKKIHSLRRFTYDRLNKMVPEDGHLVPATAAAPSATKEARAWRAFAARLGRALGENDQSALDAVKTPYGGLTARQWLAERDRKGVDA